MALVADAANQALSDAGVVERIVAAVMEQKLPPGAKLPEGPLCAAFECSRTQIRRVLVVLAERGVVTLHMNRGAFVKRRGSRGSFFRTIQKFRPPFLRCHSRA